MKKIVCMILCICMFAGLMTVSVSAHTRRVVEGRDIINRINVAPYAETGTTPKPPEGMLFAGWYTDWACTARYTEETGLAYAKFVEPGQLMDVAPYKSTGTNPEAPDILLRFAGWFADEACTTPYTADTGMAYAKFEDATVAPMEEVGNYKPFGTYPASVSEMFVGWYADAEYTIPYTADTGKAYPKYVNIAPMLDVSLYEELGEIPEKEGKIFAGWFMDDAYTIPYTADTGAAYPKFIDAGLLDNGYMDVEPYKSLGTYPKAPEGKVFAGWYTDETCTVPYMEKTGRAYPKFVDENVMNHAFQLRGGTTTESETTDMRIITTADSADYQYVRFRIQCFSGTHDWNNPHSDPFDVDVKVTTAYRKLYARRSGEVLEYEPTLFSEDSKYFVMINIMNIPKAYFQNYCNVYLYFVTADGTEVASPKNAGMWDYFDSHFTVKELIQKINGQKA